MHQFGGVFLCPALRKDPPVPPAVPVQQPLGDHIAADGAEIVVVIGDDDIHFPFRIDSARFKGPGDFLQYDALLFSLGDRKSVV